MLLIYIKGQDFNNLHKEGSRVISEWKGIKLSNYFTHYVTQNTKIKKIKVSGQEYKTKFSKEKGSKGKEKWK